MIVKANLSTDVLTHIKDLKLGELAIVLSGSILNHIVLRCDIGLVSLTDPNVCIHKTILEQKALDLQCRVLREDETIMLENKSITKQFVPNKIEVVRKTTDRKPRSYKKIPDEISRCINKHKSAILLAQKKLQEEDI